MPTHGDNLCGATTRSGNPCRNRAGLGTDHPGVGRCKFHGGATPNAHRGEYVERLVTLEAHRLGLRIDTTPEQAILDSITEAAANCEIYRTLVNGLALDMGAETTISVNEEGHIKIETNQAIAGYLGSKTEPNKAAPHIYVTMYNSERDRLFNYAATATKIGLSERMVRIAERQGEKLVEVLEAVFADPDLGLNREDRDRARGITAKHLRLVTAD